jgi:nitrogen fixation/metabolism regulation signal transduction histidine kinase
MTPSSPGDAGYLRAVLDSIPNPVFVVDHDVRVLDCNEAARPLLAGNGQQLLRRRGGELLHCIHAAETPEGCGHAAACKFCALRNSVQASFSGRRVVRARAHMQLVRDGRPQEVYLLVTTALLPEGSPHRSILILEDISELVELQRNLPICSGCKRIRAEDEYWHSLESYFKQHWDMDFSHSMCPDCVKRLYGGAGDEIPAPSC